MHRRYTKKIGGEAQPDEDRVDNLAGAAKLTPKEQVEKMMNEFVAEYQERFALSLKEMREELVEDLKKL